jgi:hypothetical protein
MWCSLFAHIGRYTFFIPMADAKEQRPPPRLLLRIRDAIQTERNFEIDESECRIKISVPSIPDPCQMVIATDEPEEIVSFLFCFPRKTPPGARAEMSRLLGQVTKRIIVGGLGMDPSDGEVRLRHSVHCEGIDLSAAWFLRVIGKHIALGRQVEAMINRVIDGSDYRTALAAPR